MKKITKPSDTVLIDPNEPLILPDGTALVGRVEWFLYALCCLDYQNLPTPMSRIEEFANALITGEIPNIEPQSRAEQFFLAILDGNVSNLPQPQSRSEVLLDKLARGEFDLSDVEPIQSRYELLLAYLIKNGGIDNIDYVLYEFSEAMKTMYNTVEKPFKSLELSGNTLVNCVLEDTENDDYTSFDKDYSGTSFTINGTSEGAIKSAILNGLTLVNLSENLNTITRRLDFWYTDEMLMDNIEKLKRNTYYTVLYRIENLNGNHENYNGNEVGIGEIGYEKNLPANDIQTELDKNGGWCKIKFQLTDSFMSEYSTYKHLYIRPIRRSTTPVESETIDYTIRGFAILEGDYMTNPIPFNEVFEGMQSVKMPVLTTTGKNLWDKKNFVNGVIDGESIRVSASDLDDTRFYYDFKENQQYVFTLTSYSENKKLVYFRYNYTDGTNNGYTNFLPYNGEKKHFISDEGKTISYISFVFSNHDNYTLSNVQLEEGSVATSYEPYKTNILTTPEDLELRGIGDVKDELNCLTGEVTERIGEVILDGSESWNIHSYSSDDFLFIYTDIANKSTNNLLCDKLPTWNGTAESLRNQTQSYIWANPNKSIFVWIEKSKLSEATTKGFKDYLQSNPIIANYQLKNESIKTVDLNVVDQNNTKIDKIHVFNETTHVNASSDELTPTVNIGKSVSYPTIIKPNTKYTVDLKRNDKPLTVNLGGTEVAFADGETRKTITTPSTLTNDKLSYYGIGAKCNEIMLIEGEIEGNVDYFTGMQSVVMQNQMPILRTCGKNLLNNISVTDGWVDITNIFKKDTTYILSADINNQSNVDARTRLNIFNSDGTMSYYGEVAPSGYNGRLYTTIRHTKDFYKAEVVTRQYFDSSPVGVCDITNYQLELGTSATSYEPYKSSILSCNDDVTLRGIGEVQDTLDCLSGEMTQRIGEVIIDGSQTLLKQPCADENYYRASIEVTGMKLQCDTVNNLLPTQTAVTNDNTGEYVGSHINSNTIHIRILSSKLSERTNEGVKQFLQSNPITLQYQLATPVIETVDLNVVDQDGNTIPKIKSYNDVTHLEVTVPKQSLLPHISAEVATDNSKDMSSLTTKHQEISEAQSAIQDNIQSQSDEIDTALMATTEIFESILE